MSQSPHDPFEPAEPPVHPYPTPEPEYDGQTAPLPWAWERCPTHSPDPQS